MRTSLVIAGLVMMCAISLAIVVGSGAGHRAERPPVVVVVLDEFPSDSLLLPGGQIDAARFPNFARLAAMSTWFPNAYTVYDSTFKAVPAILDARLPRPGTAADVRSHHATIYDLMARRGYEMFQVETASAICPRDICPGARIRRPGILVQLGGRRRPAHFRRWVNGIRDRERPGFYFNHSLLPHEPWLYLPSGRRSRPAGPEPVHAVNKQPSFGDPQLSVQNHLRHLLQVGFVDRQLGMLLDRLERTGILDGALLIVLADHGYSFDVGVPSRRQVTAKSIDEVAPVPFFVKRPGQTVGEGSVDESLVRNIDVAPTIADVLGTRLWWRHDGHSAFSAATRARRGVALPTRDFSRVVQIGREELDQRRRGNRLRWARLFGTGPQSLLLFGDPWEQAYRIGPNLDLLDRSVRDLRVLPSAGVEAKIRNGELVGAVSSRTELIPTRVIGRLYGVAPGQMRDLAVAVNGRIRALGRSFHLQRREREYFSMIVPESSLRDGANRVELFEVRAGRALVPLGGAPEPGQRTL